MPTVTQFPPALTTAVSTDILPAPTSFHDYYATVGEGGNGTIHIGAIAAGIFFPVLLVIIAIVRIACL